MIVDRGALTHNNTADLQKVVEMIRGSLASNGRFMGMDWFSTRHDALARDRSNNVDAHTRVFREGYFDGLGNVHFSDVDHLKELFHGFDFLFLKEKIEIEQIPEETTTAAWDFVVRVDEG